MAKGMSQKRPGQERAVGRPCSSGILRLYQSIRGFIRSEEKWKQRQINDFINFLETDGFTLL